MIHAPITNASEQPKKTVRIIPATIKTDQEKRKERGQTRVAAYCRVSTKQEEQLNSYEVQKRFYTEKINAEPNWRLVDIYADKGITGTSTKHRDEFNRMIRACKRGSIDLILTKSISRFARNTLDCIKYVRILRELNIDVFFEEQGIHSIDPGSELYITIYGSMAQSESENISSNVKWGKAQSAKEGKVAFHYTNFLGYRKGDDGKPEIVPEEAEIVKQIYNRYLSGDSIQGIKAYLEEQCIPSPSGKKEWPCSTITSILKNEKYKGDAIINKTFIADCISKQVKVNNGERPKYYVSNSNPAIIDNATFGRVQEEMARRTSKRKVKQVGTKTELGKYSSKYALTELLVCGECGKPYRRCTWTYKGEKKIVWRCINRLDYGKKYCHNSPSIEESVLHEMIMDAVKEKAMQNPDLLQTLKLHIAMGLKNAEYADNTLELQVRIAEIDAEFNRMINAISADTSLETIDENKLVELMNEKHRLESELENQANEKQKRENTESRISEIYTAIDGLRNHPLEYDDKLIRQIVDKVVVESKERLSISFNLETDTFIQI